MVSLCLCMYRCRTYGGWKKTLGVFLYHYMPYSQEMGGGLTEPAAHHLTRLDGQRAPGLSLSSNGAVTGTCSHELVFNISTSESNLVSLAYPASTLYTDPSSQPQELLILLSFEYDGLSTKVSIIFNFS